MADRETTLPEFLASRVERGWMPGASWWVEGPAGPVSHGATGYAAVEPAREALTEATPFDLASMTKALSTATLLVQLETEGAIDLDDPLERYLPQAAGTPYADATLHSLAVHTTGLPAWRPLYLGARAPDDFAREILAQEPAVEPGRTLYSDLGFMLLGFVLERAGGSTLDRLFAGRLASRLGLKRLGYVAGGLEFPDAAATERGNEFERRLAGPPGAHFAWREHVLRGEVHDGNAWALGGIAGHAGLFGPVEEVAALVRGILRPSALDLGPAGRRRLFEPSAPGGRRTVGMVTAGHSAATRGILPAGAVGHLGFTGTSFFLDPANDRFFVLLTNRVHPRLGESNFELVRRGFHRRASRLAPIE